MAPRNNGDINMHTPPVEQSDTLEQLEIEVNIPDNLLINPAGTIRPGTLRVTDTVRNDTFIERSQRLHRFFELGNITDETLYRERLNYPNNWYEQLSDIQQDIQRGRYITSHESLLWESHNGYLYAHLTEDYNLENDSLRTLSTSHGHEIYSLPLTIGHSDRGGPRILDSLERQRTWANTADCAIVGTHNLVYLPLLSFSHCINLGAIGCNWIYPTIGLYRPTPPHRTFRHQLWERIKVIGTGARLPIFVEFFYSHDRSTESKTAHLVGFFTIIVTLQQSYSGPLVVILPPTVPEAHMTQEEYEIKKADTELLGKMARLYGIALGVPVLCMDFQYRRLEHAGTYSRRPEGNNMPLFSHLGEPTQEFHDRVKKSFDNYRHLFRTQTVTLSERLVARQID